jgi:hypothetical protein
MPTLSPRLLSIAVILLLLINSALVVYLLMERNRSHTERTTYVREDAFERMTRTLRYTDAQKEQHLALRKGHMESMRLLNDSIRQAKVLLYSRTNIVEESDSIFMGYMAKMSQWQTTINQMNYAYYKKVRSLLTAEQQPRYDSMLVKMIERGRRDSSHHR